MGAVYDWKDPRDACVLLSGDAWSSRTNVSQAFQLKCEILRSCYAWITLSQAITAEPRELKLDWHFVFSGIAGLQSL